MGRRRCQPGQLDRCDRRAAPRRAAQRAGGARTSRSASPRARLSLNRAFNPSWVAQRLAATGLRRFPTLKAAVHAFERRATGPSRRRAGLSAFLKPPLAWAKAAEQQPEGDRHVDQVPGDAVQEGGAVGAGEVVDLARQPAAQRHADTVAVSTRLTRAPASRAGNSRARSARSSARCRPATGRTGPRRRRARSGRRTAGRTGAPGIAGVEPSSSVPTPPIRSAIRPEASRLTTPRPSISDSISAPRAGP